MLLTFVPFFIYDGCYYWFHRLQHAVPALWRFHAVHHAIEELNAMNCSHHWMEGVLRVLPLSLLIQLDLPEVGYLAFVLTAWGQFIHSNTRITLGPFERLLVSPCFDRAHHALDGHGDRNFAALFSVFDLLFGTAYFPNREDVTAVGLREQKEATTLRQYLLALKLSSASGKT